MAFSGLPNEALLSPYGSKWVNGWFPFGFPSNRGCSLGHEVGHDQLLDMRKSARFTPDLVLGCPDHRASPSFILLAYVFTYPFNIIMLVPHGNDTPIVNLGENNSFPSNLPLANQTYQELHVLAQLRLHFNSIHLHNSTALYIIVVKSILNSNCYLS